MSHWAEEEEWWDCLISERGDVRSIFYTSLSSEQHFIGEEEIFWLKWHQQLINFRSPQNFTWATDIKLIHLIFIFKVFICNIEIRSTSETITLYDHQDTQWWSIFIRQILQALPTHSTFTKLINPPATKSISLSSKIPQLEPDGLNKTKIFICTKNWSFKRHWKLSVQCLPSSSYLDFLKRVKTAK